MGKRKHKWKGKRGIPLKAACQRAGVSLAELARRSGIDRSMVSAIANGRVVPSWHTICRLADALECSLGEFDQMAAEMNSNG